MPDLPPGKQILVIEDEATQVLLLSMRLRQAGYDVCSAMTGTEGLRKALAQRPDLILLDIILPEMNGVEVCERLRANASTRDVPVILLTASSMSNLARQCQPYGISECLMKPYEMDALLERIAFVLAHPAPLAA